MMEVCIITDHDQWDNFLVSQGSGHLLQSYEWGELHQFLHGRIYRLGAMENGRIVGAMMLSVVPIPLPGLRVNWLYCPRGPVVEHPHSSALSALLKKAHALAREEQAVVLRLEPNIVEDDSDRDTWLTVYRKFGFRTNPISVHGRRSWVLDLRPDIEHLFANFRKAWRQNVRLAERMNVTVREMKNDDDFDAYYDLLKITSERDNFFIHNKEYHREILRQFADQVKKELPSFS